MDQPKFLLLMASLQDLSKLVRHHILTSTTEAATGHPTSSLSATDLMTALFFKYLQGRETVRRVVAVTK